MRIEMKGSDFVEMTINIGGELIKLNVNFDEQIGVRDAEQEVKNYIERLKKAWPQNSEKNILAMAAYQFARWYQMLLKLQQDALDITDNLNSLLDQGVYPDAGQE